MERILDKIVQSDTLHAKWINTLSYLEFVGARKISKVLSSDSTTITELQHLAEESRHSFFFKKVGIKNFDSFPQTFESSCLLGGRAGKTYFHDLDAAVADFLGCVHSAENYWYVTLLIEERALSVYSIYDKKLCDDFPFRLTALLKEESSHLVETSQSIALIDPLFQKKKTYLKKIENYLFLRLKKEIEKEVLVESKSDRRVDA